LVLFLVRVPIKEFILKLYDIDRGPSWRLDLPEVSNELLYVGRKVSVVAVCRSDVVQELVLRVDKVVVLSQGELNQDLIELWYGQVCA
jgi:hypothetical protein